MTLSPTQLKGSNKTSLKADAKESKKLKMVKKDDFFNYLEEIKDKSDFFPSEEFLKKPLIVAPRPKRAEQKIINPRKRRKKSSSWKTPLVAQEVFKMRNRAGKLKTIDNLLAEDYMIRFDQAAKKHRFKVKRLSDGRSAYQLGKGPVKLSIISGIHGEERAGPVSLLAWLELTKKGCLIPGHVTLLICPLVGHEAWNHRRRHEKGKMNLNSVWERERAPEYIHELKKVLARFKSTVFLDIHEDSMIKDNEPYIFRHQKIRGKILELQGALGVSSRKGLWKSPKYKGASETFVFDAGCKETSTLETPQTKPLRSRVGFDLAAIKWVLENVLVNDETKST
jgi:hypothetical protein